MSESDKATPLRAFRFPNVYWLWLAGLVIGTDQITKQLVVRHLDLFTRLRLLPFLNLTQLHNTGAAFSSFTQLAPLIFVLLSVAVSVGILIWIRLHPYSERLMAAALALILGGALGNAIDRATRGFVIDFIDIHAGAWHWPAFNLADSAITLGAALLLLDMWRKRNRGLPPEQG